MADNINENGLPPNDVDVRQYHINNPAVSDSEHQAKSNTPTISSPAVSDSEYQTLASKSKLSNVGLVLGESAGENFSMFL